jgi:FMN phosphatase YigB (HAD superfamily)
VIKALICDLDHTLFPTRSIPRSVVQPALDAVRAANRNGSHVSDAWLEEALEACWDLSFDEVARRYALPDPLCQAWADSAERLEANGPLELYPDAAVLWTLPLRRFLVTTGYRRFQESKIAALDIARRFEGIYIDALGDGRLGKEALFRRLMAEHRLVTHEVAVLGDNAESEIAAGHRLGLWTIQIVRERAVSSPSAHFRIDSLTELPTVLESIRTETHH